MATKVGRRKVEGRIVRSNVVPKSQLPTSAFPLPPYLSSRLLLCDAMVRAQSPSQVDRAEPANLSRGKQPRQGIDRQLIGRVVELRHDYQAVGNVKIHVTGRQLLVIVKNRARQIDCDNFQRLAIGI